MNTEPTRAASDIKVKAANLATKLLHLSFGQLSWVERVIDQFLQKMQIELNSDSDLISKQAAENFGDVLRIHHSFSREAFSKDKFEYALEDVLKKEGQNAELAPRGNRGYDLIVRDQKFSLKTQADRAIKEGYIHISKFMELGGGQWSDQESDLAGLREQFFANTLGYERILSLRCLTPTRENPWIYELVEIPKALLLEAKNGVFRMVHTSRQNPKPGYCDVFREDGKLKFRLYFDGGGERKLQIQMIDKTLCVVHARWTFNVSNLEITD